MNDNRDRYDDELLAVLETIATPDHRDAFAADVLADLRAESVARHTRTGQEDPLGTDHAPSSTRRMLTQAPTRGSPRRWPRRLAAGAAIAAAATLVLLAWAGLPGRHGNDSTSALATTIMTAMHEGATSVRTLQGTYVETFAPSGTYPGQLRRVRFAIDAAGSYRAAWISPGGLKTVRAYDAGSLTMREWWTSCVGRGGMGKEYTHVGDPALDVFPGPPIARLGAYVRGALADRGTPAAISTTTYLGRAAWRLDLPGAAKSSSSAGSSGEIAIVDQDTGFTLRYVVVLNGRPTYEVRVTSLRADQPLDRTWLTAGFPTGTRVQRRTGLVSIVDPAEIAGRLQITTLAPVTIPEGYALALATVYEPGADVVGAVRATLLYRRGFDRFVVDLFPNGSIPADVGDPYDMTNQRARVTQTMLEHGALAGRQATLVLNPEQAPYLWVTGNGETIAVAGDLTPDELIAVAESLRPLRPETDETQ